MSDWIGIIGAVLLALATLPQAWCLLAGGSAADFHWGFIALNLVGLIFLSARSWELRESAFLAVNLVGVVFWTLAIAVKTRGALATSPRTDVGRVFISQTGGSNVISDEPRQ